MTDRERLAGRLASQIYADSISLIRAFTDEEFLKENGFNKENILSIFIPNSYDVYWNVEPNQIRDKMFSEYQKFWNDNRIQKANKIGSKADELAKAEADAKAKAFDAEKAANEARIAAAAPVEEEVVEAEAEEAPEDAPSAEASEDVPAEDVKASKEEE